MTSLIGELCIPEEQGGPLCVLMPPETPKGDVTLRRMVADVCRHLLEIVHLLSLCPTGGEPAHSWRVRCDCSITGIRSRSVALRKAPWCRSTRSKVRHSSGSSTDRKPTTVELEALEEAMLADLEAIRAALEETDEEVDEGNPPLALSRIVDANERQGNRIMPESKKPLQLDSQCWEED